MWCGSSLLRLAKHVWMAGQKIRRVGTVSVLNRLCLDQCLNRESFDGQKQFVGSQVRQIG
jgi:hypothetical protein